MDAVEKRHPPERKASSRRNKLPMGDYSDEDEIIFGENSTERTGSRPRKTIQSEKVENSSDSEEIAQEFDLGEESSEDEDQEDEQGDAERDIDGEGDNSDAEEEEEKRRKAIEEEKNITTAWGKKRSAYYSADTVDFEADDSEEEQNAQLEEEEALELQQARLGDFEEQDLELPMQLLGTRLQDKAQVKSTVAGSAGRAGRAKSERALLAEINQELDMALQDELDQSQVESVARDLSGLSKENQLAMLARHHPELPGLAKELQEALQGLRQGAQAQHAQPSAKKKKKKKAKQTKQGQASLDDVHSQLAGLRLQLLRSYGANLCLYFLLQAGQAKDAGGGFGSARSHPVMAHLLRCKKILNRLDKLQAQAGPGGNFGDTVEQDNKDSNGARPKKKKKKQQTGKKKKKQKKLKETTTKPGQQAGDVGEGGEEEEGDIDSLAGLEGFIALEDRPASAGRAGAGKHGLDIEQEDDDVGGYGADEETEDLLQAQLAQLVQTGALKKGANRKQAQQQGIAVMERAMASLAASKERKEEEALFLDMLGDSGDRPAKKEMNNKKKAKQKLTEQASLAEPLSAKPGKKEKKRQFESEATDTRSGEAEIVKKGGSGKKKRRVAR